MVDLEGYNFLLDPANVRRNDTSAASIDEWTGERLSRSNGISDDIKPDTIAPLGNYAVQILWQDGFNQVRSPAVMSQSSLSHSQQSCFVLSIPGTSACKVD